MKMKAITGIMLTLLLTTATLTIISTNLPSLVSSNYVQVLQSGSTEVHDDITTNTTWTLLGSPYIIVNSISIEPNVFLKIEPGVVVKFTSGKTLKVYGKLIAQGNVTHKITFTSNSTTPTPGDWGTLRFNGKDFLMSHVLIEYADKGIDLVNVANVADSLISYCNVGVEGKLSYSNNLTVTDNTGDGLSLSSSLRIENSNVSSNGGNGITITAAIDMDNCLVSNNTEDGVILSNGEYIKNSRIIGNGGNGTCILGPKTTIENTTICDNGGDGIWAESVMSITQCNITRNDKNGIKNNHIGGTTTIENSTISSNGGDGIWIGSSMSITGCNITENAGNGTSGHLLTDGFTFSISSCNISSNSQNGVTAPRYSTSEYINMYIDESIITYNNMSGLSGRGYVLNSTVSGNKMCGILGNYTIEYYNVITWNHGGGFNGTGSIYWSSIFNNTPYDAVADVWPNNITATKNWWGTDNGTLIEEHIWHHNDNESLGYVVYEPWLLGPPTPIDPYPPKIFVTFPDPYMGTSPDPYIPWIDFEHHPMVRMNEPVCVSVNVTDNGSPVPSGVDKIFLSYRVVINQSVGEWWNTTMTLTMMYNETSGNWAIIIPAQQALNKWTNVTVEFFIQAYDKDGNPARSPENDYHRYTIKWLPIGDINGDAKVDIEDIFTAALHFGEGA